MPRRRTDIDKKNSKAKKICYKQIEVDILNAIANGTSLDDLHNLNPNVYPTPLVICKKMNDNPKFKAKVDEARKVLSNRLVEKLHWMRDNPPNQKEYQTPLLSKGIPMLDDNDKPYLILDSDAYKKAYDVWSKQLKSLHDELHQLGSIFNSQFIKLQKVEQKDITVQEVHIVDYKDNKPESKDTVVVKDDVPDIINDNHISH